MAPLLLADNVDDLLTLIWHCIGAGAGVHVYPCVGGELPCPSGRREGDGVLRREEPALRGLPDHRPTSGDDDAIHIDDA